MNLISIIRSIYSQQKSIVFFDGDQSKQQIIPVYKDYFQKKKGFEFVWVECCGDRDVDERYRLMPKIIRNDKNITKVFVPFRSKKENTDKFITSYIQKSVAEGYKNITVVSSDYDFIDIFKMTMMVNPSANNVSFKLIVPNPVGIFESLPNRVMNIEIIKGQSLAL